MRQSLVTPAELKVLLAKPAKRSKYGNRRTTTPDGEVFDSAGEAARWEELKLLQAAQKIRFLRRQVRIELRAGNNEPIIYPSGRWAIYVPDFAYCIPNGKRDWVEVYEDFKGFITPEAKLKMAIVQAMHGRPVIVTKRAPRHPRKRAA